MAVFLGCTSTGRVGLCFLWFYVQELPNAQPALVLVSKRLRRRDNGLKSHPIDWEKPGIEPATSGLQDIGLSPTPRRRHYSPNTRLVATCNATFLYFILVAKIKKSVLFDKFCTTIILPLMYLAATN